MQHRQKIKHAASERSGEKRNPELGYHRLEPVLVKVPRVQSAPSLFAYRPQ